MLPRYRFSSGGGAGSPIESRAAYAPDLLTIRVWLPALASAAIPCRVLSEKGQQKFLSAVREFPAEYRMTS